MRAPDESSDSSQFVALDQGRLVAASEYAPLLRALGWDTFEKVMAITGGQSKREFPGRRTVRINLETGSDRLSGVYLKRYEPGYLSTTDRWLRRLGWPSARDEAWREWQGIQAVGALGIATAAPIAVGQRKTKGIVDTSFLMTAEISGAIEGGPYAKQLSPEHRRRFLQQIARLARRLHQAGWVHKDFYISHVLVVPPVSPDADSQLFLIDLQRAIQPRSWLERWVVKDLAALAYSALKSAASPRDLWHGYLAYCGGSSLTQSDRQLARKTLRRVAWLKTRTPKHDKNFQQLA
jgi:heptose I phosphotransferase